MKSAEFQGKTIAAITPADMSQPYFVIVPLTEGGTPDVVSGLHFEPVIAWINTAEPCDGDEFIFNTKPMCIDDECLYMKKFLIQYPNGELYDYRDCYRFAVEHEKSSAAYIQDIKEYFQSFINKG